MTIIRLKVKLSPQIKALSLKEYSQSWFTLDTTQVDTIEQFKIQIIGRVINSQDKLDASQIVLCIDDFQLPSCEKAAHLLRDSDTILVAFGEEWAEGRSAPTAKRCIENLKDQEPKDKKPKLEESQPRDPYRVCLVGTSMIKNISPLDIFGWDVKWLYKPISGGSIKQIHQYLQQSRLDNLLDEDCKLFCITCGSNDVDSIRSMNQVTSDFTELMTFLMNQFPHSVFLVNLLIPRLRCKYTQVKEVFEPRRLQFNSFLQTSVSSGIFQRCILIEHKGFESTDKINSLLGDGIHLSITQGVPLYVKEITETIVNNEL